MLLFPTENKTRGAACADLPEIDKRRFFTEGGNGYKAAIAICATCPVRAACLEEALSFEVPGQERYGVWGGLTARERDRLVRRTG